MEILNVGPLELIIILVIMFVILGPKDMVKTAQRIGRWVRSVTTSPMWREVWGISQDIRELPKKLMDETGLEEALTDIKTTTQEVTNEFNASINEVKQSATIPEIEHIRIENPLTTPPPDAVPSSVNNTTTTLPAWLEQGASAPTAEVEPVPAETTEPPAMLEVAEPAPAEAAPAPKKTRRKKPAVAEQPVTVEEQPAEGLPTAAEQPAVVEPENAVQAEPAQKKPRRKTTRAAETASAEAQPASPIEVYNTPVEPAAQALDAEAFSASAASAETTLPVEPPAEKKPRRKKTVEVVQAPEQPASQSLAQPVEPLAEAPAAPVPTNGAAGKVLPEEAQSSIAPARKPRAPRAARQEKPAETSAAAPDVVQAVTNNENGAAEPKNGSAEGANGSIKPARPRKPRKTETQPVDAQQGADAQESHS